MASMKVCAPPTAIQTQHGIAVSGRPDTAPQQKKAKKMRKMSMGDREARARVEMAREDFRLSPFSYLILAGYGDELRQHLLDYLPNKELLVVASGLRIHLLGDALVRSYLMKRVSQRKPYHLDGAVRFPALQLPVLDVHTHTKDVRLAVQAVLKQPKHISPQEMLRNKRDFVYEGDPAKNLRTCKVCKQCKTAYFHLLCQRYICHNCCTTDPRFALMSLRLGASRYVITKDQIKKGCPTVAVHPVDMAFDQRGAYEAVLECHVRKVAVAIHGGRSQRSKRRDRAHRGAAITSCSSASGASEPVHSITAASIDKYVDALAAKKNAERQGNWNAAVRKWENRGDDAKSMPKPKLELLGRACSGIRPASNAVLVDYAPGRRTLLSGVHEGVSQLRSPECWKPDGERLVPGSLTKPDTRSIFSNTRAGKQQAAADDEALNPSESDSTFVWVHGGGFSYKARSKSQIRKDANRRKNNPEGAVAKGAAAKGAAAKVGGKVGRKAGGKAGGNSATGDITLCEEVGSTRFV